MNVNMNSSTQLSPLGAITGISTHTPTPQSRGNAKDIVGASSAAQFESVPDTTPSPTRLRRAIVENNTDTQRSDTVPGASQSADAESAYVTSCAIPTVWQRVLESLNHYQFLRYIVDSSHTNAKAGDPCPPSPEVRDEKPFDVNGYQRYLNAVAVAGTKR